MSKVKGILELLYGHALLHQNNQFEKDDIDLALSELRGLVMGMKKTEHDDMCGSRPEWHDKQNWGMCDCSIRTHNHAVETIANELFGKE